MSTAPADAIAFARPWFDEAEAEAAAAAVRSGWVVGGPQLEAFEAEFARICGVRHAIGMSSWTTGAFLVLHCLGIGPGDEVVVPSLTFIATANVAVHVGARPIFADVANDTTWNVDPGDAAARITERTRALLPVDQLGLPCDIDAFRTLADTHGLTLIDDAACALGSRNRGRPVGSLAPISVFSLHARKVVTTGEGGVVTTDDDALAERLRRLRNQGMSASAFERRDAGAAQAPSFPEVGFNFRMTDVQAAIGRVQLGKLDTIVERRRAIAERYLAYLANHPVLAAPRVPEGMETNWQSFQIAVRDDAPVGRDAVVEGLAARGVPARIGVMAAHREAPYRDRAPLLPATERAADRALQLPMHPGITESQSTRVVEALDAVTRPLVSAGG